MRGELLRAGAMAMAIVWVPLACGLRPPAIAPNTQHAVPSLSRAPGRELPDDPRELKRLCAEEDDVDACARLGTRMLTGEGMVRHVSRGLRLVVDACARGQLDGCNVAGVAFQQGVGTSIDLRAAAEAFEQACNAGHVDACWNLGHMFLDQGEREAALGAFIRDCENGGVDSCRYAADLYLEFARELEAYALLEAACRRELAGACTQLGQLRVDVDVETARWAWRRSCEAGDGDGCGELAGLETADDATRRELFERGCELASPLACGGLGAELAHESATPTRERGWQLLEFACAHGQAQGCASLLELIHDDATAERTLDIWARACADNSGPACCELGEFRGAQGRKSVARQLARRGCELGSDCCEDVSEAASERL